MFRYRAFVVVEEVIEAMMLIIGVTRLGNVDSGGERNQDEYDAYLRQ